MAARLLKISIALLTLLVELRYTLSRLLANPLTVSLAPAFQALRTQWTEVQALEISLHESLSDAKAQVDIADAALDAFAVRFSNALLALTGQKRDAPLYLHYFKVPLHVLSRPILAGQLQTMAAWIPSLVTTPHPTLAAMKSELEALVAAGQKAEADRDALVVKIDTFRDVGERKQLFDKVNAERKAVHGALSKIGLATPGLPSGFANQFFKLVESSDPPEETIDSLEAEIKDLLAKIEERKARIASLTEEAADEAKKEEEKAKKVKKLAELNENIAAMQKAAQALEDEID